MSNEVLTLIISLLGTAIGTIGGILASSKLTNFRLQQLEEQVKKHNSIVEKTIKMESIVGAVQNDIEEIKGDVHEIDQKLYGIDTRVSKLESGRG